MFHLIGSLIGNVVELGVGAAIGIVFKDQIVAGVDSVKKKIVG